MSLVGAKIYLGQQTVPFHRRNERHLSNRCFSIVSRSRSLDLEVIRAETGVTAEDEQEQRDEWVDAFRQAIERANASASS